MWSDGQYDGLVIKPNSVVIKIDPETINFYLDNIFFEIDEISCDTTGTSCRIVHLDPLLVPVQCSVFFYITPQTETLSLKIE